MSKAQAVQIVERGDSRCGLRSQHLEVVGSQGLLEDLVEAGQAGRASPTSTTRRKPKCVWSVSSLGPSVLGSAVLLTKTCMTNEQPNAVAEQAEGDLELAVPAFAGLAPGGPRAATVLDVGGRAGSLHEVAFGEVAAGEAGFDDGLACQQPVHGAVEVILGDGSVAERDRGLGAEVGDDQGGEAGTEEGPEDGGDKAVGAGSAGWRRCWRGAERRSRPKARRGGLGHARRAIWKGWGWSVYRLSVVAEGLAEEGVTGALRFLTHPIYMGFEKGVNRVIYMTHGCGITVWVAS